MRLPKPLLVLCLCAVTWALSLPALACPLEDGHAAYRKGDWTTAVTLLRPLADQGNAEAQERLGRLYERGRGVPRDYAQALEWHLKAAEQGDAAAQSHAGFLYRSGATGRQDYAEALKWYRRGAEQGNRLAQVGLGAMYAGAEGVELDAAAALVWFRKGADQGDALGQLTLGSMYKIGKGVPRDKVEAVKWFTLAAAGTDQEYEDDLVARAKRELESLDAELTPGEVAQGRQRAAAWKPATAK